MRHICLLLIFVSGTVSALELDRIDCKDPQEVAAGKEAFARAKSALSRIPSIQSVSISECEGLWAGKLYEKLGIDKINPAATQPSGCGIKVVLSDINALKTMANYAFLLGTYVPYGQAGPPKRMRICGVLAEQKQ